MNQNTNQVKIKSSSKALILSPLISIVTVVFNGEEYLEETIKSVVSQSYINFEYIIIDGGSTDRTIEIIKKYEKKITYWISETDDGIYDAMNKGIKLAKGDLLGILNSGDFYEQNALEKVAYIYDCNKHHKQNLIISGSMYRFDLSSNLQFLQVRSIDDLNRKINRVMPINHPATFISKYVYEKLGYFNPEFKVCGDYDFIFRAYNCKNIKFIFTDQVLVHMMMGGKSETFNTIWTRVKEDFAVRKDKMKFVANLLASFQLLINNFSKFFLMLFFGTKIVMFKEKFQRQLKKFWI